MRRAFLTVALVLCTACGHGGDSISKGVHTARQTLHVVPIAAEDLAKEYAAASDARIEYCRKQNLETSEKRAECMGPFGDPDGFAKDLSTFKDAYDQAAIGLEALEDAAKTLESRLEAAQ